MDFRQADVTNLTESADFSGRNVRGKTKAHRVTLNNW